MDFAPSLRAVSKIKKGRADEGSPCRVFRLLSKLENDANANLYDAARQRDVAVVGEVRTRETRVVREEVRQVTGPIDAVTGVGVVQHVVRLTAKLDGDPLTDLDVLEQARVQLVERRPAQDVAA